MEKALSERERPIGVFDSGVGGISVLRELVALMPNENFIFYGDSKNAPYGTRSLEEVQELTCRDADFLLSMGVKALVVACNTATSAAIGILRQEHKEMPIIGIEPALKPAVLAKTDPTVLVMATPMTLREEKFHALMLKYREQAKIIKLPCPGLVEYVERGELDGPGLENFLQNLFADYEPGQIDCVVLGCTHYPFVRRSIEKVLGGRVRIFDGGEGTARETRRRLFECGLINPSPKKGTIKFKNSLVSEEMDRLAHMLMQAGSIDF